MNQIGRSLARRAGTFATARGAVGRYPADMCSQTTSPTSRGKSTAVSSGDNRVKRSSEPALDQTQKHQKRKKQARKHKFVPRKAPLALTEKARTFFKGLLNQPAETGVTGVLLNYKQASSGEPRMVFTFEFVGPAKIDPTKDEAVSLEVLEDGSPKPPEAAQNDGLPKLYIHHNAFMKVLGGTLDFDYEKVQPLLFDREGNKMDPNA